MMVQVKNGGLPFFHGSFAAPSPLPKTRKFQLLAQAAVPSRTQVFPSLFVIVLMSSFFLKYSCSIILMIGYLGIAFEECP